MVALLLGFAATGCESGAAATQSAADECARLSETVVSAHRKLGELERAAPTPEAPLSALATHCELVSKSTREIAASVGKASGQRTDVREAADGARMLAELAADRFATLSGTIRELGELGGKLEKVENAANDALSSLGTDTAKSVGCETKTPPGCAALLERMQELAAPPPAAFDPSSAAAGAGARAALLDGLATAADGLTPPAAKQPARDDLAKRARDGAAAYRNMATSLQALAPLSERANEQRIASEQSLSRLSAELEAAGRLCGARLPARSATLPAAPSAPPLPPSGAPH
jgi:hypothetical protein